MKHWKLLLAIVLVLALSLSCFAMAGSAVTQAFRFEAESTSFVAVDSTGRTVATSNQYSTWAWSLNLSTSGVVGDISNKLAFFRTGGLGGYIEFTIPATTDLVSGSYDLWCNVRPNANSYCSLAISVNGGDSLGEFSLEPGVELGGSVNVSQTMHKFKVGMVTLVADGTDTVRFTLTGYGKDNLDANTGFALDYLEFTPATADNDILSITAPSDLTVAQYVAAADLALPESVQVTLGSGSQVTLPVSFDTTHLNLNVPGTYTLPGTLNLTNTDYTNSKQVTVSQTVTVSAIASATGYQYVIAQLARDDGADNVYSVGDLTNFGGMETNGYRYWFAKTTYAGVQVYIPEAGCYTVSYGYKTSASCDAQELQLSVNGTAMGDAINKAKTSVDSVFYGTDVLGSIEVQEPGYYTFTWEAKEGSVFALGYLNLDYVLGIDISSADVVLADPGYDLTWNVQLRDGFQDSFSTFNDSYTVVDHGVIVAATQANMEQYGRALAMDFSATGAINESNGKYYAAKASFGTTAFNYYTYRRTGVAAGMQRYVMFYLVYEDADGVTYLATSSINVQVAAVQ